MSKIARIPAFNDNYLWLGHSNHQAYVVDPGDAKPVLNFLRDNELELTDILLTHHHADHIGGVDELISHYPNCNVFGPDTQRFPMVTAPCKQGDKIHTTATSTTFEVFEVPGHTIDHIAFYSAPNLFVGDTLFSAGCGRLFEGTPEQMFESLNKIKTLPEDTKVFCAHEYTEANCTFALAVTPQNEQLKSYYQQVKLLRKADAATIPTILATEKLINPFLRVNDEQVKESIIEKFGLEPDSSSTKIFEHLRKWKDNF